MSLSNFEVHEILGCLECTYADQEKLKKMKKFHDSESWSNCSNVVGVCSFPFRRDIKTEDGKQICKSKRAKSIE